MTLRRIILYKNSTDVVGVLESNDADKLDFEDNYKDQTDPISEIIIAETTIVSEPTWDAFKALIVSPLSWADVKVVEKENSYTINLLQ